MVGHKTESIYRRYQIVRRSDLHDAAARLNALTGSNGKSAQPSETRQFA